MSDSKAKARTIVGLEIHVQLQTRTKLFCGCEVRTDAPPNSRVCPVCLGHPGALPVLNRQAFSLALLAGVALNCRIARHTKWDRKSYFYPDLPKNYQISQYDLPLASGGYFVLPCNCGTRRIGIKRTHLEEDAGKNIHDASGCTLVDLNRAGTPLLEIVTEPDLTSADEAYAFCTELQRLVKYLGISEASMQKGQMRFEPNINVAIDVDGAEYRTPIVEIKNLNSFRSVRRAVAYESQRQLIAWEQDNDYVLGKAANENRGWNDEQEVTEYQRGKEEAHDYRYFPEPDLVPAEVTDAALATVRSTLPELPVARRNRFVDEFGLPPKDADTITAHRQTADLFEQVLTAGGPPDIVGKQFVNVWLRLANNRGVAVTDLGVEPERIAELAVITAKGTINKTTANQLAEVMLERPESPGRLADELGMVQVQDDAAAERWVEQAFADNARAVRDALANPKKAEAAAGFLRGQVMKVSAGKADPRIIGKLIETRLAQLRSEDGS